MKEKILALTWPKRILALLQCFLTILFLILYLALGRLWNGGWYFVLGVFLCAVCIATILYADELYRYNLRFSIRDPEDAKPADWVFTYRWITWIICTVFALVFFLIGLIVV